MKKPKVTIKTVKALYEGLQKDYADYREKVRAHILAESSISNRRALMTIVPANEKGMINGMTIPELVLLVNLNSGNGESTILETTNEGKNLVIIAKRKVQTPWSVL